MAEGRLVNKRIGMDKAVGRLSCDTCRLAFTWALPHLDRDGRVTGDPAALRSLVFPRRDDVTSEMMHGFMAEWASEELVVWYEAAGDLWLEFPAFRKNQPNLRHDREPSSFIPPAKSGKPVSLPADCRQDTGGLPADCRESAASSREKEGREDRKESDSSALPGRSSVEVTTGGANVDISSDTATPPDDFDVDPPADDFGPAADQEPPTAATDAPSLLRGRGARHPPPGAHAPPRTGRGGGS